MNQSIIPGFLKFLQFRKALIYYGPNELYYLSDLGWMLGENVCCHPMHDIISRIILRARYTHGLRGFGNIERLWADLITLSEISITSFW